MHFTPAVAIGFGLGVANWAFWRFSIKRFFRKQGAQKGFLALLSMAKLGVLASVIWFLITHYSMDPVGFMLGFSITIVLTLTRYSRWN